MREAQAQCGRSAQIEWCDATRDRLAAISRIAYYGATHPDPREAAAALELLRRELSRPVVRR